MHDLVAAQDVVKTACAIGQKNKLKKISKITIRLGKIIEHNEELSPENLQFNFGLVKRNTLADKAKLVINQGKGRELTVIEVEGDK